MPFSSKIAKMYPCESLVKMDNTAGKAMEDQLVTVIKDRLSKRLGTITSEEL